MWEEIFSQGLLSESDSVIVYVPSKELKVEFFREMMALGVAWMGGEQMSERDAVSPYNAFRIICTDREYGIFKLRRGDKEDYESDGYDGYIRCTYTGAPYDMECSTDEEFFAFLSASGKEENP